MKMPTDRDRRVLKMIAEGWKGRYADADVRQSLCVIVRDLAEEVALLRREVDSLKANARTIG